MRRGEIIIAIKERYLKSRFPESESRSQNKGWKPASIVEMARVPEAVRP